ncbi:MAG: hypothetical protein KAJ19_23680 [Gammaproteobacteria bacterium]|nr:hypothetical protein [Gammaproteobacteria bacterium]
MSEITYEFTAGKDPNPIFACRERDRHLFEGMLEVPLRLIIPRSYTRGTCDKLQEQITAVVEEMVAKLNEEV